MEVTTANFTQLKPKILQLIDKALYFAVDLQFTGLRYQKFQRDHISLLPYQKYRKLKYVAETYQILQLGLSIVTFDGKLKVFPFNFYLFPRNPAAYDRNINMQLGCVKFNADNGMDWNKWIREGVNYISLYEKSQIQKNQKNYPAKSVKDILQNMQKEDEVFARQFINTVKRVSKLQEKSPVVISLGKQQYIRSTLKNLFYRYVSEEMIDVQLEEKENTFIVKMDSSSMRVNAEEKRKNQQFGFALIFERIWKSRKPIIGHNCYIDLLYMFSAFVAPLPDNYFDYKKFLLQSGNTFYDTKFIALTSDKYKDCGTRLQDLVKILRVNEKLCTQLFLQKQFSGYSLDNPALHEAGYDSFITAWVYQQLLRVVPAVQQNCKNILNQNYSFFFINLGSEDDIVNSYYAHSIVRINIQVDINDDVRERRNEEVKRLKEGLSNFQNYQDYQIYQGFREIFVEIKNHKQGIVKTLLGMKIKDIKTFPTYLKWQAQRARNHALSQQDKGNYRPRGRQYNRGGREKEQTSSQGSKHSQQNNEEKKNFKREKR